MSAAPQIAINGSRPLTRRRRADMLELLTALHQIIETGQPMTCRQVFYQAVTRGLIAKTETEYKASIVRLFDRPTAVRMARGQHKMDEKAGHLWFAGRASRSATAVLPAGLAPARPQ